MVTTIGLHAGRIVASAAISAEFFHQIAPSVAYTHIDVQPGRV